jgi:PAS domain S-box-containing protein
VSAIQTSSRNTTRTVYIVTFIAIILTLVAGGFSIVSSYNDHLSLAREQVTNTATVYHDNVHLVIGSADSMLTALENLLRLNPSSQDLHGFLEEANAIFPMVRTLLVFNNEGIVVGDSRPDEAALGVDAADRQYFIVHQQANASDTIFVDDAVQSRVDGAWSIPFSKGIYAASGEIQWVIVASIEPHYFSELESAPDSATGIMGYIVKDNGQILANIPYQADSINRPLDTYVDGLFADIAPAEHDALIHNWNNQQALIAHYAVEPYGITVVFQQPLATILLPFYRQSLIVIVFATIFLMGVLSIARRQISLTQNIVSEILARQETEADYRRMVETAAEGIWQIDHAMRITFANQRLAAMLGYRVDELVGKLKTDLLFAEDYQALHERLSQRQQGKTEQHEVRYRHKSGDEVWAIVSSSAVFDEHGKYAGAFAMVTDITTRKRAERELEASQRKLQAIFDSTRDGLLLADDQQRYVDANPTICNLLGYTREEMLQLSLKDIIPADQLNNLPKEWHEFVGDGYWNGLYMLRRKDGGTAIVDSLAVANILPGLHLSVLRDVTERLQMELELRESESRFRTLADNAPMFIWVTEPDKSVSYVNQTWLEFTGRTVDAELGFGWLHGIHPQDTERITESYPTVHDTWQPWRVEARFRSYDNTYRWLLIQWTPRFQPVGVFAGFIGTGIDITQRKQAEDALRQSETRFRMLADNTPMFIWLVEPDKSLSYVNKAWLAFTGQTWDEGIGQGWLQVLHPDDVEWMMQPFPHDAQQQYQPFETTARFRRHDGEYRSVLMHGLPRYDLDGSFTGYIGSSLDITPQLQFARELKVQVDAATADLRESEKRYRTLADVSNAYSYSYVILQDGSIEYEWVTEGFERISGYTVQDLMTPNRSLEVIFPEDYEAVALLRERLYAEPLQETIEYRMTCITGEVKYMIAYVMSEWDDAEGRIVRVTGTAQDISRLKRAEDALRTERNFLQSIMDTMPGGILVFNSKGQIVFANTQTANMLGIERDKIVDTVYDAPEWIVETLDGQPLATDNYPFVRIMASKQPLWGIELSFRDAIGQRRPIVVNGAPLLDEEGNVEQVIFVIEDISLRLKWQQEIQAAFEQEKQLNEIKNRFVTLISHELRTPLSIIMTSSQLLQRHAATLNTEQIIARTDKIQKQVMRLKRIMEDVSFINKTDSRGHELQLTPIDLPSFVQNIIDGVFMLEENPPQVRKQYSGTDKPLVSDETLLYQILVNLISNAVKYTLPDGTVSVDCRVTEQIIVLQVADTGIGIPDADQTELFQSFHRASNASNIPGTGLGLNIVRRAVDTLDGTVTFSSELDKGTTFTVTLPNLAKQD